MCQFFTLSIFLLQIFIERKLLTKECPFSSLAHHFLCETWCWQNYAVGMLSVSAGIENGIKILQCAKVFNVSLARLHMLSDLRQVEVSPSV